MKQSTMLLIALTPSPAGAQLQKKRPYKQQLDQLRQQLIQQNQALHQLRLAWRPSRPGCHASRRHSRGATGAAVAPPPNPIRHGARRKSVAVPKT